MSDAGTAGGRRTPSDGARATAAKAPGTWVYEIDPWFDPDGEVPPFGIVGAWKADDTGSIVGEFQSNVGYRPSPASRGFRRPLSALEQAMQLEVTGYGGADAFAQAISNAVVWVLQLDGHAGEFSVVDSTAGRVVEAYTSPDLVGNGPLGQQQYSTIGLASLLSWLPAAVRVVLNPGTAPTMVIPESDAP